MRLLKKYFFLFILINLFSLPKTFAQTTQLDSLIMDLKLPLHDTLRCRTLGQIVSLTSNDFNVWPAYNEQIKNICEKNLTTASGETRTIYLTALAQSLNRIGYHASFNGDVKKALEYYTKSLKIKESVNDLIGVSNTLQNIAIEYYRQGEVKSALEYFDKCIKIQEKLGDKVSLSTTLQNMGAIYFKQNNIHKSFEYFTRCIKLKEELGIENGNGILFSNLACIYESKGDYKSALEYFEKGLKVSRQYEDYTALCTIYNKLGMLYLTSANSQKTSTEKTKLYRKAFMYADSSFIISKELNFTEALRNVEHTFSRIDSASGNYADALEHYKQHIIYSDSLLNVSTRKASVKNQLKYEFEKKEAILIEQQEKEKAIANEQNARQQIIIWFVSAGMLLVIAFAFFVFRNLKITRKQKLIIEEHQKEILDSIRYAKRIQTSLLPTTKYIERIFKKHLFVFLCFTFVQIHHSLAQSAAIDTFNLIIKSKNPDSVKLRELVRLGSECEFDDILIYALPAEQLATKIMAAKKNTASKKIHSLQALNYNNLGYLYNQRGDVVKGLDYYVRSLNILEDLRDYENEALLLQNIAGIYSAQGDFKHALEFQKKGLHLFEKLGQKKNMVMSLNNIALIYKKQGDVENALSYLKQGLEINDALGDINEIGTSLNNIGILYKDKGEPSAALNYFNKSLVLYKKADFKRGIVTALRNVGIVNNHKGNYKEALLNFKECLNLSEEIKDKELVSEMFNTLLGFYFHQKEFKLAGLYADSSLALSKQTGYASLIRNAHRWHASTDSAVGNFAASYEHYKLHILYRDSILNEQTRKASIKSQLKYEFEKKEAVLIEQQEKEKVIANEQSVRQQIVIWSVTAGMLLVIAFAFFVFRNLKIARKQKLIIEEHQKEILDSIHYAKRIQTSLLPTEIFIERIFKKNR